MNKRLLAIAIAAGLASPFAAQAGASIYGTLHVSLNQVDQGAVDGELDLSTHKSNFGIKGSEDLGDGMSAIYAVSWQVDVVNDGAPQTDLLPYDRFVGLKGSMGTVKFGTVASNYKQTGSIIDPFWSTGFEMRATDLAAGFLYNANGVDRGRLSDAVQYSNKFGDISLVANMTFDGTPDNNTGLGLRYKAGGINAYFDYIAIDSISATTSPTVAGESAMKVGLTYAMGATTVGLAQEMTEDMLGADYTQIMATHKMGSDTVALTYGQKSAAAANADKSGVTIGYVHGISKNTSTYAAYTSQSNDDSTTEISGFAFGLKHKF